MAGPSLGCKEEGVREEGNELTWAEVNRFNRLTEDWHVAKEPNRIPAAGPRQDAGNLGTRVRGRHPSNNQN